MIKMNKWVGLCALLLSLQAYGGDINIQDAWIRPVTPGQENAMVGMVINSARQARIVAAISPAYNFVAMQGPDKKGGNKTHEIEFIDLPAQKSVALGAESVHLLLLGNKNTYRANDKIPVIVTIQFEDKTSKTISIMTQPVRSKSEAATPLSNSETQAIAPIPSATPPNAAAPANKVETVSVTPPPQPAPVKAMASPVVASPAKPVAVRKQAVAETKPVKTAPVAAQVVTAPVAPPAPVAVTSPVTVSPAASVAATAPVAIVAPAPAPPAIEPKKTAETKAAIPPKQDTAQASAECISLAEELRNCDPSNDRMLEWCETSAKSKYTCQLSKEQLKKLKIQ